MHYIATSNPISKQMSFSMQLDPFQIKAIEAVQSEISVFVAAPTGSGKTVIAESAIEKALERNEHVIYTAPIKALSNQKYRDFRKRFSDEKVGILTGDVAINSEAPIVIMTTEIYRNCLFESSHRIKKAGWVIFDEFHYLDDIERGTVWEEAVLFTPPEMRILALSATVPNVDELANWVRSIHHRELIVIKEDHRPVPLHFFYQCQGQVLNGTKDLFRRGYLNRDSWKLSARERRRGIRRLRAKPNRLDHLIQHLIQAEHLPCIHFVFGRRRTEFLAWESLKFDLLSGHEKKHILEAYDHLIQRYDLQDERTAQEMRDLIEHGIAYHHAGMLPTLKEVIEQLFTSRLIKLIFTTETFALGINMPARSVVFDELAKYYGTGFRNLTTRDFYQMAGRAGRRGIDTEGFVYVRVHPNDLSFTDVEKIIYGTPEPIKSQLNTTYATLLNLYRDLGEKLIEIYPRTFHAHQAHTKKRERGQALLARKMALMQEMQYIVGEGLSPKGEFAASLFGYELIMGEMYEKEMLEKLDEIRLNVLLSSLIYSPRKGQRSPHLNSMHRELQKESESCLMHIFSYQTKYKVPAIREHTHFHAAYAMESWTMGKSFDELFRETDIDEGELVRHFRMVIQLLRELIHSKHTPDKLRGTAKRSMDKINRGVVDAEKQLRI